VRFAERGGARICRDEGVGSYQFCIKFRLAGEMDGDAAGRNFLGSATGVKSSGKL
jgi:hypothetical protein